MTSDYFYGDDILTTPDGCRDEYKEYAFQFNYSPVGSGGKPAIGIPLITDSDADFIARAVRGSTISLVQPVPNNGGGDVAIRWTNVNGRYMQKAAARHVTLVGTSANPRKLVPAFIIPAGGSILFDVVPIDTNYANASRLYVVFIGVKRYRVI